MKNAELWKRIVREGLLYDLEDSHPERVEQDIFSAQQIVDTRTGHIEIGGDISWDKFDRLAVPFDKCWIEGRVDNLLIGTLLNTIRTESGWSVRAWAINAGKIPTCFGAVWFDLDRQGTPIIGDTMTGVLSPHMLSQYPMEIVWATVHSIVWTSLDVLMIAACKNVDLASVDVPEKTKFAAKKHGGDPSPAYRYHVLTIRPAGSKPGTPGIEIGTMPRHVCRGHFKEYTAERPLFGNPNLVGRFFIPPHMRGDKKNGIVEKDYEVRASA